LIYRLEERPNSRGKGAGESTWNDDTGYFFVEEGKPAGEVDASVGYYGDGDAACPDVPGAE